MALVGLQTGPSGLDQYGSQICKKSGFGRSRNSGSQIRTHSKSEYHPPPGFITICVESLLVKTIMDIFSNHYFVSESVNSLFTQYYLR